MDPAQNTNISPIPEATPNTTPVNTDQTPSNSSPNIPTTFTVSPSSQKKKSPVLILLLIVILIGLAGSFLFFNLTSIKKQLSGAPVPTNPPIIPPPTLIPTVFSNPFSSPSGQVANPFASPSASTENPFGKYENPFVSSSPSGTTDQPYKNPFSN